MLVTNELKDGCWLDAQIIQVIISKGTEPCMVLVHFDCVVAPKAMQEFEKHKE